MAMMSAIPNASFLMMAIIVCFQHNIEEHTGCKEFSVSTGRFRMELLTNFLFILYDQLQTSFRHWRLV